ncbi:reverse transcriptase domain-containing protein [Trichonephila clavipes]|nr:reverse transcriptase domain-containing protein [Trichonephila clavipes]
MNTIHHHIHPDANIACHADDIVAVWHSHNDITESEKALNTTLKELSNQKVDLPTYLGVTLDPELRFSKHTEQTTNKALGKLNILRKLCGTSWGSRPHTLKSTFCTVIRPVLEYATPIWTPASFSVKRKLDSVQHRAAKIIIEQCHRPIMKRPNNNAKEFLINGSILQGSKDLRLSNLIVRSEKNSIWIIPPWSSFRSPSFKNPPKNTCFELGIVAAMFQRRPCNSQTKGLETIAILSQDNFAIAYTDSFSDEIPQQWRCRNHLTPPRW